MWLWQWSKSRSMRNEFGVPIRNFARVTDTIYRGALPSLEGYRALVEKAGVRRVCSIIEHERRQDRDRALAAGVNEWRNIPFSDTEAPDPGRVREWFEHMRASAHAGPVFTHCRGGRHRTGVLVGAFRVADCGWTKERALAEMLTFGWYSARGHAPLLEWFLNDFDPEDYRAIPRA